MYFFVNQSAINDFGDNFGIIPGNFSKKALQKYGLCDGLSNLAQPLVGRRISWSVFQDFFGVWVVMERFNFAPLV